MVQGFKHNFYDNVQTSTPRHNGHWERDERKINRADLILLEVLVPVFKIYKGLSTIPFDRFFTMSSVNNTRGHSAKIVKHHCHLYIRRHFFCGTVCHSKLSIQPVSTYSRIVWINFVVMRWASSWTRRPPSPMASSGRGFWIRSGRTWYVTCYVCICEAIRARPGSLSLEIRL